jgi:diguanylate cyclase (GGDEF)-like protein
MREAPTILAAVDSPSLRASLARTLEAHGYRVLTSADGLAAFELAWTRLPHLALLDAEMPRINGYQVARLLRNEPRTAHIPVVILAARETAGDIFWGIEAGADAYVTKSAGQDTLLATIARMLAERESAGPSQRDAAPAEPAITSAPRIGRPARRLRGAAPGAEVDVLARLSQLLDQELYEATILNQIWQLATELRDHRRVAERAGRLLARFLDYQVVALLFLQETPAEGLALVRGLASPSEAAIREQLLAPLPPALRANLPPSQAVPLTTIVIEEGQGAATPLQWQSFTLGDRHNLLGSFCLGQRTAPGTSREGREFLQALAISLFTVLDNARLHARLRETAITDALTGVFNHRYFIEQLGRYCERGQRDRRPLSLVLLDVDYFKRLNDTHGHQAGDLALRELGAVLRENIRPGDFAARYGGEEFAIVLPDTRLAHAVRIADRLRQALAARWAHAGLSALTASAGVASAPQNSPYRPDQLVAAADRALYAAKAAGRNRTVPASPAPADPAGAS